VGSGGFPVTPPVQLTEDVCWMMAQDGGGSAVLLPFVGCQVKAAVILSLATTVKVSGAPP